MTAPRAWNPANAAAVICDMWDAHHCVSAAERVRDLAPRIDHLVSGLRDRGALIIHAPGDAVDAYAGTPARQRAIDAPFAPAMIPFQWNIENRAREGSLPVTLAEPGPCSCETVEPCCQPGASHPWTRQTEAIRIAPDDAVTDDGQEVFNLLEQYGIADVVVVGVHANVCVLARSYGIRQLVYLEKRPVLCSDLTDSFHRDPRGHRWGHEQVLAHIERYWCPTVTSAELIESLEPSAGTP